jgi:uncharacterized iron-regulated membrane protein
MLSIKRAFAIHGRLGAWAALPLAFIMLTGSLAVYGRELDAIAYPASACAHARQGVLDVPWSVLAESASLASSGRVLTMVAPEVDGASAWALVEAGPRDYRYVFLDPHDGRARGIAPFRMPRRLLRDLHRALLLGENVGLTIVTSFALMLATSMITGLRFWSRHGTGGLSRRYHRYASAALSPFLVIVLVTTSWYWAENLFGFFELRPSGPTPSIGEATIARVRAHEPTLPIDQLVAIAQAAYPELEVHSIAMPTPRRAVFSVSGHAHESALVRELANQVFVDPFTGEVLEVRRADRLGPLAWWEHSVDAIHFGTWGGEPTRALWMTCGVACIALPLTGFAVRRARARYAPAQR